MFIELILNELYRSFGEDIVIYRENVKEGFEEPSFFVPSPTLMSKSEIGNKYKTNYSYQIIYFPRTDHINDDIEDTITTFNYSFFKLGNYTVHNKNMNRSDNALVFTFDLYCLVIPKKEDIKMESLKDRS
ncbi:hypothetical protein DY102_07075 [Apilactobacillus timberlakei]|uniref:phage tail terminator family protein n=1 Tax=Apilactobacillus timberlakei TaxID=2008380 RepID=UPI00112C9F01|nr:hypothetical protein [Apilactobacillus timberlakei]TPR21446.1 hypothetical protein DY102_07075 [Apilactobacillus timberlakei]